MHGQKQFTLWLKFVNPPAKSISIGFKEDEVATLSYGADKVANPGMMQRFGAANPDHRSTIFQKRMHLFAGNGGTRARMEDFRGIYKMDQWSRRRRIENLRDAGSREF